MPMRIAGLLLLPAFLLLAPPASAGGTASPASCGRDARSLAFLEAAAAFFGAQPGPVAAWLAGFAGRWAESAARDYADRCVALNQVQVLGSHNSYHQEPVQDLIDFYTAFEPEAIYWQYTHAPLAQQFGDSGVRQIELDVYADPDGGMYASPIGYQLLQYSLGSDDFIIDELLPPGLKVFHVQEFDWQSSCPTFADCLAQVKAWSDAHPGHLPIMILVEVKDDPLPFGLDFPAPVFFGAAEFAELEADILSVFPLERIVTPDEVRGGAATLEAGVLAGGWPRLESARGRVLFGLDNRGKRDIYTDGHPSLEGRLLFTDARPGEPDAAFVKQNDPLGNEAAIQDLVAAGYIVRTRSDADTIEARLGDPTRSVSALATGAQFVSTDYEVPDPRPEFNGYSVAIPDGHPGRCNPVNGPPGCRSFALER